MFREPGFHLVIERDNHIFVVFKGTGKSKRKRERRRGQSWKRRKLTGESLRVCVVFTDSNMFGLLLSS